MTNQEATPGTLFDTEVHYGQTEPETRGHLTFTGEPGYNSTVKKNVESVVSAPTEAESRILFQDHIADYVSTSNSAKGRLHHLQDFGSPRQAQRSREISESAIRLYEKDPRTVTSLELDAIREYEMRLRDDALGIAKTLWEDKGWALTDSSTAPKIEEFKRVYYGEKGSPAEASRRQLRAKAKSIEKSLGVVRRKDAMNKRDK